MREAQKKGGSMTSDGGIKDNSFDSVRDTARQEIQSPVLSTFKAKSGKSKGLPPHSLHPLFDIRRHRNPAPRHLPQLQNLLQPQPPALRVRRNPLPHLLPHHHLKPIMLVRCPPENTPRARVMMRALRRAAVGVGGFGYRRDGGF